MQTQKTLHSDALAAIQATLKRQELIMTRIFRSYFWTKAQVEVEMESADLPFREFSISLFTLYLFIC